MHSAEHSAEQHDELVFETRGALVRELVARWFLFALVIGFPLIYLPEVLFGGGASATQSPLGTSAPAAPLAAWVHLVVVTTGDASGDSLGALTKNDAPELWAWREAAAIATNLALPSPSSAANAATLWTGRWPEHHGVTANDLALAGTPWTLAESARAGGARTAAILQAPFTSATRIRGFQDVLEDRRLAPVDLRRELRRVLADSAGERLVLWIHVAGTDGEPLEGRRLDGLLGDVREAFEDYERWSETLAVLLPLSTSASRAAAWVRFPAIDWGGRRGTSPLALVDLTAILRSALRIAPPDPTAHEPALQGLGERALDVFRGWETDLEVAERQQAAGVGGAAAQPAALAGSWKKLESW